MCMHLISFCRSYPVHDSANILLVHSANYHKHVESVREWYSTQHHNWLQLDGQRSQWWVWDKTRHITVTSAQQIQNYLVRITSGLYTYITNLPNGLNITTIIMYTSKRHNVLYVHACVHLCMCMNIHVIIHNPLP